MSMRGRIAAIGYCFGGQCVLELARSGRDARAVVSFHGGLTTHAPLEKGAFAGEIVAYCGQHDPFAPPDHTEALREELIAAEAHWQITVFGDAAHGFTDPGQPRAACRGSNTMPWRTRCRGRGQWHCCNRCSPDWGIAGVCAL